MSSIRFIRVVCFVAALLLASLGWAQSLAGGGLEGTVTDSTGALVAGANLTAKNTATGAEFTTTSSKAGLFSFPVLPVGTYEVTADMHGFAKIKSVVRIAVGSKPNLPLVFQVAGTNQEVTVTSEAPLIETTRTQVSSNVNERSIKELPVNGRNFIDFVLLTPGVTRDVRTGDISFAGQRGTLNSLTVDGADNNNTFFGQTTGRAGSGRAPYQFSQDSVQEFQVASNAYSAELGRAGGAVINVVTKSGTNAFHGAGFEYYRDQSLNAYDPIQKLNFALLPAAIKPSRIGPKNKYHFNQFGGDIGGPIVKNKLFFFFDYDGQRNVTPNVVSTPSVDFSTIAPGDVPFATAGLAYLQARAGSYGRTLNQDTYLLKVDYNLSQRNQLSGRWNRQLFTGGNFENGGTTNAAEHTGDSLVRSDTFTTQLTSTVANSLVNVARFTYLRDKEPGLANSNLPEAVIRQGGQTLLTVGRNSFSPRETTIKRQQYADNVTWVSGRHTWKFGGDVVVDKILNFFPGNFSGAYVFSSLADFGRSLQGVASPLTTYAQAFAGAGTTGPETHPDIVQAAGFAQDDWRVTHNLTLNLGLRYDVQSVKQPSVQNPLALAAGFDTSKVDIDKNEWAPRIGFAYTPFSSGKMVWRGGYGIFYGNTPSIMIGTAHSNNGINVGTLNFNSALAPFYPNTECGAPVATPNCAAPAGGAGSAPSIYVFQKGYKNPRVQQANLGTEYALTKDLSFNVSYLFVKSDNVQRTADQNLGNLTTASVTDSTLTQTFTFLKYGARPNTNFQRISVFESNAEANYNGLTLQLNKRFSNHFQGGIAYTWSHVIDNAPDATAVVPFSSGDDAKIAMYPTLPDLERSNGVNDQRHRFVLNYVWELNYGHDLPMLARVFTNGWQFSGIFSAASGQPYSSIVNGDLNGDGNRNDRLPGTARNQFTLPASYSFDPRITRTVALHAETLKLQLFGEAFNLFNHLNVTGIRNVQYALQPNNTLKLQNQANAPSTFFGLPTAVSGQRIIQLGAKVIF